LLPEAFRRYLSKWYFADFDPAIPAQCSRHSVSHGVAHESEFNEKNACIAFLLIDQLYYFAPEGMAS